MRQLPAEQVRGDAEPDTVGEHQVCAPQPLGQSRIEVGQVERVGMGEEHQLRAVVEGREDLRGGLLDGDRVHAGGDDERPPRQHRLAASGEQRGNHGAYGDAQVTQP